RRQIPQARLADEAAKRRLHAVGNPTFETSLLIATDEESLGSRLGLDQVGKRSKAFGRPGLKPPPRARMQADERSRSIHARLPQQAIRFPTCLGGNSKERRGRLAGEAQRLRRLQLVANS